MNWQEYFINIAEQVKLKSKDENTQIGSVIVGVDNEILSTGYNSFPRGLNDNVPERQERPTKYFFMIHSESNAIANAARIGVSLKGSSMYMTCGLPCSDCARLIINSGIKKVICKTVCTTKNKDKWNESQERSLEMLTECGVEIIYY